MSKKTLKAKKLNMSQVFLENGKVKPITWVEVEEFNEDLIEKGAEVTVTGKSKGKGFGGVVKKYGFKGGPATHGQSDRERAPGSIGGTTDPAKVIKGKKMPGNYGGKTVTLKNKKIMKISKKDNRVALYGPLPGGRNSVLKIIFEEE